MAENLITASDADFDTLIGGDKIAVAKLNVDENPQTAMAYDVMSIPTLIVYSDGVEKKRIVGARSEQALLQEIGEFIA